MVGMGMAYALGQNPLMGLITGSITLTGGHGTGAAWGRRWWGTGFIMPSILRWLPPPSAWCPAA